MASWLINPLDVLVLVVLVVSGLYGLMRGLVKEVLGIASWICAFFAALYGFAALAPLFRDIVPDTMPWAANWGAGILIFVVTLTVLYLVSNLISRLVKKTVLSPLDRSLGFVFGLVRGWGIMIGVILGLNWIVAPPSQPDWLTSASTRPLLNESASGVLRLVPAQYRQTLSGGYKPPTAQERALEAQRQFNRLVDPRPVATTPPQTDDTPDYSPRARQDLDRLIEGTP